MEQTMPETPDVLTIKEIAKRSNRSVRWVGDRIRDGSIPSLKVGGLRLVPTAAYRKVVGLDQAPAEELKND